MEAPVDALSKNMGDRDLVGSSVRLWRGKDGDGVLLGKSHQQLDALWRTTAFPPAALVLFPHLARGWAWVCGTTEALFKAQDIVFGEKKSFLLFSP